MTPRRGVSVPPRRGGGVLKVKLVFQAFEAVAGDFQGDSVFQFHKVIFLGIGFKLCYLVNAHNIGPMYPDEFGVIKMIFIIFHGSLFQMLALVGMDHYIIILGFEVGDLIHGNYLDFCT